MRKFHTAACLLCCAFLLASCAALGGLGKEDKHTLRFRPEKGAGYTLLFKLENKINQRLRGRDFLMRMNHELRINMTVTKSDAESATLLTTLDHYKHFGSDPTRSVSYDSRSAGDVKPPENAIFGPLVGKSFYLTVASNGEVLDFELVSDSAGEAKNAETDESPGEALTAKPYDKEYLGALMQGFFFTYPDREIGIGDVWTERGDFELLVPMSKRINYTLKGQKDETLFVDVASTFVFDSNAKDIEYMGLKIRPTLKGSASGVLSIDRASGLLKSYKSTASITGDMVIAADRRPPGMPGSWPIGIKTTCTMELHKL